jgi:tRNA-U20a,U20b-dihydrouridine synthase
LAAMRSFAWRSGGSTPSAPSPIPLPSTRSYARPKRSTNTALPSSASFVNSRLHPQLASTA